MQRSQRPSPVAHVRRISHTALAARQEGHLASSTFDSYRRKVDRHILPTLGRVPIRRLRSEQLDALYESMLRPTDRNRPLAPKTVLEVHLIIRGGLADAEKRGLVNRNVALVAHAPRLRTIPKLEPETWNAQQLQAFLAAVAGHRLFPALWVLATTGMRPSELLGPRSLTWAFNPQIVAGVGFEPTTFGL